MPLPPVDEPKLLEQVLTEALREDIANRSSQNIWNFLASAVSPTILRTLSTEAEAREMVLQMVQSTTTGPLLMTISRHLIRRVLALAAEKAQVREVPRTLAPSRWEVDEQSILDIEKLFL